MSDSFTDDSPAAAPPDGGQDAPASLRDTLAAAVAASQEGGQKEPAPTPPAGVEDGLDRGAADKGSGRRRDEAGRFAADASPEHPPGTIPPQAAPHRPAPADAPSTGQNVAPPDYLPDADKAALAALPDEARAVAVQALERQREAFAAHVQDVAVERRFYADLRQPMQAVAGFAEHFKAHPKDVLGAWATVQNQLLTDPAAALLGLAQQFNVDLSALAANPPSPHDMALAATQREVQEMRALLTQRQQQERAQSEYRQRALMQETAQTIEAFGAEKAADGQPLRPHFQALRADMATLIASGQARDLNDAYDKAAWANPNVRAEMIQKETARRLEDERKRQADQVARAKAASGSALGAPGASVPPPEIAAASVGEALRNAIAAQGGRF